jgi:CHAT domain-containing protein
VAAIFRVIALADLGALEAEESSATAEKTLKTALGMADSAGFGLQRVTIRGSLARLAVKQGRASAALAWADAAVSIADSMEAPDAQIEALEARAAALEAARRSEASDGYLRGIALLESWRGRLALGDLRMGVAEPRWGIYEGAIRTLLARARTEEALSVAERARARLLLEVMAERDASRPASSALEDVRRRLRARFEERAAVGKPEEKTALDRELRQLTDSLSVLEAAESARHPQPASVEKLRLELLTPGRALLTFFWGDDAVYGWWTTRDTVRSARLGSSDSLSALVEFLRGTIDRPGSGTGWVSPAQRAYERLIAPLHPTAAEEVLVVADGPLAHIPLEVLIPKRGAAPWGTAARFIYGPSASVLLDLSRKPLSTDWPRSMLALGNPSGGSSVPPRSAQRGKAGEEMAPPLPYAASEARAVHDLFRQDGSDLLLAKQATPAGWLALDPSRYRYLHFAAHARVSDRRPEDTHLVLSGGTLDLAAIRGLRLRAELVTLSACETALGRRVRGEGIIGLPHAFLAAGARGTLVTLWRIGDRSAADFMREFYEELHAGRPPAEALRAVRHRRMMEEGPSAHPSRWAAFVLVGGMRQ